MNVTAHCLASGGVGGSCIMLDNNMRQTNARPPSPCCRAAMDNMQRANLENPLCQRQAEQAMKKDGKQVRELTKLIFMFILIRDMFYTSQYVRMFYILWYIYI